MFRDAANSGGNGAPLRCAMSLRTTAKIILDSFGTNPLLKQVAEILIAVPKEWNFNTDASQLRSIAYTQDKNLQLQPHHKHSERSGLIISNGQFITSVNHDLLNRLLSTVKEDVIAINVNPQLQAYREKIRLTQENKIVGFRRIYSDCVEPAPTPTDWPHHVVIKGAACKTLFGENELPLDFANFVKLCSDNSSSVRAVSIGGYVLGLNEEASLLSLCKSRLNELDADDSIKKQYGLFDNAADGRADIPQDSKIFGKVSIGENVVIGRKVSIFGPTIIADNVKIGSGTVINSSIICPDVSVPNQQYINNTVVADQNRFVSQKNKTVRFPRLDTPVDLNTIRSENAAFRFWPKFSYIRTVKRIADIIGALAVIVLFAPIVPFIALVLKLNSPGPLFYKARRQGLYGKEFDCIKFRTMIVGADKMQDKLRVINQMDGPQFKIENDPRISGVGKFLRDTFLDEIPQFLNVLYGQMSIVGPRPSPEKENTLCPAWRDARLSVKPGITGLWQVLRTRQPLQDFQEWIYYDIKYVKNMSFKTDLWICAETAKQMLQKFISKF